jgi:uncharacterized damage-inducible protein DinB
MNLNEKNSFLERLDWEMNTSIKVMKSMPADKLDVKPHPTSRSAKELMHVLIHELAFMKDIADGELDWEKAYSEYGDTLEEITSRAQANHMEVMDKLKNIPDEELQKPIRFTSHEVPRLEAMLELMFDQIHHRGQLSIYVRMNGGKVPQIYGPSYDEPM